MRLTPAGTGGIAVISLTGPGARDVAEAVFRPGRAGALPRRARLALGWIVDAGERIDQALLVHAPGGWEIHIHGGPAAVQGTLHALQAAGAELQAPPDAPPTLPTCHPRWRNPAIGAELQAALPAAPSALVAAMLTGQWSGGLSALARDVEQALASGAPTDEAAAALRRAAEGLELVRRATRGAEVALAGPPNAGKSSLANALVGRPVALVSDVPGTTRDWVRELALIEGVPVWITDTAGLWAPPDGLDRDAVARAREQLDRAELIVWLAVPGAPEPDAALAADRRLWTVAAQADRYPPDAAQDRPAVSVRTETGLDELKRRLLGRLRLGALDPARPCAFTERQAALLLRAAEAIETAGPASADHAGGPAQRAAAAEAPGTTETRGTARTPETARTPRAAALAGARAALVALLEARQDKPPA